MWMRRTLGRCLTTIVGESAGARAREGGGGRREEGVGLAPSLEEEWSLSVVLRSMRDSSMDVDSELFDKTDLLHTSVLFPLQTLAL